MGLFKNLGGLKASILSYQERDTRLSKPSLHGSVLQEHGEDDSQTHCHQNNHLLEYNSPQQMSVNNTEIQLRCAVKQQKLRTARQSKQML